MNAIEQSLEAFLTETSLRVAVLKGKWGVGKTYFWRNFLARRRAQLNFRAYSYVSLFGVASVRDLERRLFENLEPLTDEGINHYTGKAVSASRLLKLFKPRSFNLEEAVDTIQNALIKDFLICFDDLERKDPALKATAVLGLISRLKEERNCRILIVYNDDALQDDQKREIGEYREKVVDLEALYAPSIEDNLRIIWPKGCPTHIAESFEILNLNNIRIMQRVEWGLQYFGRDIFAQFPQLRTSFERKIAILTILHHAYGHKFTLQDVLKRSFIGLMMNKNEEEKQKYAVVRELSYSPEDCDEVIVDYLTNGYVVLEGRRHLLQRLSEAQRIAKINEAHRSIWEQFHSNFSISQQVFIERQINFVREHLRDLSLRDVMYTLDFVRELEPKTEIGEIETAAIETFIGKFGNEDIASYDLGVGERVAAEIRGRLRQVRRQVPLVEVMEALTKPGGWSPSDLEKLEPYSVKDYVEWFASDGDREVLRMIREFLLRFSRTEEAKGAVENVKLALEQISSRSALDAARVRAAQRQ